MLVRPGSGQPADERDIRGWNNERSQGLRLSAGGAGWACRAVTRFQEAEGITVLQRLVIATNPSEYRKSWID